uniref:CST complex subunit STN1 n=1 Tax=Salarias fasciatus TaxID=181472 RepID=A0A672H8N2_SALFA
MQAAAMDPAEEPPSILWGLDPLFSAFVRLYVRDILQMAESTQVPGIYFYNLHPVYKVDVLGTVVYKRERDDFFCYGVDDGTAVINCLCWKSDELKTEDPPVADSSRGAPGGFNLLKELKELRRTQQEHHRLEIGELVRVRGKVKTSRHQREITASIYYKVNDPVMSEQISWMMELPQLYREFYDKRLQLEPDAVGAKNMIKDFLEKKSVSRFRPHDVQDVLLPLISAQPHSSPADQLRQLLKEALQVLQDDGFVYRRVKSQDEVFLVTTRDKDLLMAVQDVIREDSKREKYAEKGCHVLHILSAVRQRFSLNVSRAALELVLSSLECSSDIISPSDQHYIAV